MSEVKKKVVFLCRGQYEGNKEEMKQKGYYEKIFYDFYLKQDGETVLIKRPEDKDGDTKVKYNSFTDFLKDWGKVFMYNFEKV